MTTGKRLFQYALLYKKILIWALVLLTIAVTAELTGPMIAKKMIDDHISELKKRGINDRELEIYCFLQRKGIYQGRQDRPFS